MQVNTEEGMRDDWLKQYKQTSNLVKKNTQQSKNTGADIDHHFIANINIYSIIY